MATTSNVDHFFQTSTSLAESDRKRRKASNTLGQPVKFPAKLLSVVVDTSIDPSGNTVFVAEADGSIAGFNVSTNKTTRVGRNTTAPMTCVTTYAEQQPVPGEVPHKIIFAGGWDKNITRFELEKSGSYTAGVTQTSFKAHHDFLKCLLIARAPDKQMVLLSGGADGDLNIWTLEGQRLASLRPQSRGIEFIVLDPYSTPKAPRIFFSTSQREIYRFDLPATSAMRSIALLEPIVQHETSVYKLIFDNDGDLWTASADKTAKRLVRENNYVADTTLVHPDFVRDVVLYEPSALAITACRDEGIRVWNAGTSQLLHLFSGHFEEVTGLALIGTTLFSVSIDATLRRWSLAPQELKKAIEEKRNPEIIEAEPEPKADLGGLTQEEEAELLALMENEEADILEKMVAGEQ